MMDYAAISKQHETEYGTKVGKYGKTLAEQLYSNPTHFIFELLQNAEDAKATTITFTLYANRLEVRHNGKAFDESDVRSICSINESTKTDDMTKIGKFGLGFKSVFAHTQSPEIHSQDVHFRIKDYVHPIACEPRDVKQDTLIVLPFDHAENTPEKSYDQIHKRLADLNTQTLLFLSHIDEIHWQIDGENLSGHYLRETRKTEIDHARYVDIISDEDTLERWLLFDRPLIFEGYTLNTEIAFSMDEEGRIKPVRNAKLVVFFPTELETRFGFLMQGAYRTTTAREGIREDHPLNQRLIRETAVLVRSAINTLRDMGLLTPAALMTTLTETALADNWQFKPIYDEIVTMFEQDAILPTNSGTFATSDVLVFAQDSDMRELIPRETLQRFYLLEGLDWIASLPAKLETFLRKDVGVDGVTWCKLCVREGFDEVLHDSDDAWLLKFYAVMDKKNDLLGLIKQRAIIRLEDNRHITADKAWLPSEKYKSTFPTVKQSIYNHEPAKSFLKRLGLREPDIADEVLQVLKGYEGVPLNGFNEDKYWQDMALIAQASKEAPRHRWDNEIRPKIKKSYVFRVQNAAADTLEYIHAEGNTIVDRNTQYDFLYRGNPEIYYIDEALKKSEAFSVFSSFLLNNPVQTKPNSASHNVHLEPRHSHHQKGLAGFDPNSTIIGLERALKAITHDNAFTLWKLLLNYSHLISGQVKTSSVETYPDDGRTTIEWSLSTMGKLLQEARWLPDKDGRLRVPSEISIDHLPDDFKKDEIKATILAEKLNMKQSVKKLAEATGILPELLTNLQDMSLEEQAELMEAQRKIKNKNKPQESVEATVNADEEWEEETFSDDTPESSDADFDVSPSARNYTYPSSQSRRTSSAHTSRSGQSVSNGGRWRSYVVPEHEVEESESHEEQHARRQEIAQRGIDYVMDYERQQGRTPREMPQNNPGYDIESSTVEGHKRLIEVKSLSGAWDEAHPAALTETEFHTALKYEAYWLYVVEYADTQPRLSCIPNPAWRANQYLFDDGWRALSEQG